jgi:hypothetical protein
MIGQTDYVAFSALRIVRAVRAGSSLLPRGGPACYSEVAAHRLLSIIKRTASSLTISQQMNASQRVIFPPPCIVVPYSEHSLCVLRMIAGNAKSPCVVSGCGHMLDTWTTQVICGGVSGNGNYLLGGASCLRIFTSGQGDQCLGGDAARSGLFSRENRGPSFRRNAVPLPPLQNRRHAGANIRGQSLRRVTEINHVSKGAEISHTDVLRTNSP